MPKYYENYTQGKTFTSHHRHKYTFFVISNAIKLSTENNKYGNVTKIQLCLQFLVAFHAIGWYRSTVLMVSVVLENVKTPAERLKSHEKCSTFFISQR